MRNEKWKMRNPFLVRALSQRPHFSFVIYHLSFAILLCLGILQSAQAKYLPTDARALNGTRVSFLAPDVPLVEQVGAIGMTVSDMDASIDFYSKILSFEKVSDVEVTGEDYERLQGVFGLRMRVVRM